MNDTDDIVVLPCRQCGAEPLYKSYDEIFSERHAGARLGVTTPTFICPNCGTATCASEENILKHGNEHHDMQLKLWNMEQKKKLKDTIRDYTAILNKALNGNTKTVKLTWQKSEHDPAAENVFMKNVKQFIMCEITLSKTTSYAYEGFSHLNEDHIEDDYHASYRIATIGADFIADNRFAIGEFLDCDTLSLSIVNYEEGAFEIFRNGEFFVRVEIS